MCNHSCDSRCFPAPLPACGAAACPVMLFLIPPGSEVAPPRVEGVRPCERAPLRWSSTRSENICCSVQHYSIKARISITMQIPMEHTSAVHRWGFLAGLVFGIIMPLLGLECKDLGKTIHGIYFFSLFFPMGCAFIVVLKHS